MTAAVALLFTFGLGFAVGVMALYTVWRVAVCSPSYWSEVFKRVSDIFPPGRWVRLGDKHLCMHCPMCGFAESSESNDP